MVWISGCEVQEFSLDKIPSLTGQKVSYDLDQILIPGFAGKVEFIRSDQGLVVSEIKMEGAKNDKRYFGKLGFRIKGTTSTFQDVADLGEVGTPNGQPYFVSSLYSGKTLYFDSLIKSDAIVRILEIEPGQISPVEVLRGEIGSNTLQPETKSFAFEALSADSLKGRLEIRRRENGNWVFKAQLTGLVRSGAFPLSFYLGSSETGLARKQATLGSLSVSNQGNYSFDFPIRLPDFNSFDTLRGFLAVEEVIGVGDTVRLSVCNFGGNRASGNQITYYIYQPEDSIRLGSLSFIEKGAQGSPLELIFKPLVSWSGPPRFISIHRGNVLDGVDSIWTRQLTGSVQTFNNLPNGNGGLLTFSDLANWNAHVKIVQDVSGFSNLSGIGDLGSNEVLFSDSIIGSLNQPNPLAPTNDITGTLILRPRRNGKSVAYIRLTNQQPFVTNSIVLRQGPIPSDFSESTELRVKLLEFNGGNQGPFRGYFNPTLPSGEQCTWDYLKIQKAENAYPELYFDDGDIYILSRGTL